MPRRGKKKSSDGLRQTTLLDVPTQPSRQLRSGKHTDRHATIKSDGSPPSREEMDSSSDELAGITFAPIKKTISISTDDDPPSIPIPLVTKKPKRILSSSSSENELVPSSQTQASRDSESEESEPVHKKRRLRRLRRRESTNEKSSSEDNLENLADEVEEDRILDTRMRQRGKTVFQKNLDKLRRRKLKLESDDSGSTEEYEGEPGDASDAEVAPRGRFKGSRPSGIASNSDASGSDYSHSSDFIVEDDTAVDLPPEFSMETHQDLSHQFKKIFQFFVHIAVQPAKKRAAYMKKQMQDEQYFSVPLQITRRNLSGLRDSLVSSSIWKPEFKESLQRHPNFELTALDFAVPSCDACHLGGRLSTLLGRLGGPFYNPYGFEPIPFKRKKDAKGKEFNLGRFCAKRTRVFHEFSHWEYNLFQGILREITELRSGLSSTGFHRVAYAGGANPPEDLDDADGLCDWLDKRKVIDMEWQTMKTMMESARHLELEKKKMDD